jgi:hypothetical protein
MTVFYCELKHLENKVHMKEVFDHWDQSDNWWSHQLSQNYDQHPALVHIDKGIEEVSKD